MQISLGLACLQSAHGFKIQPASDFCCTFPSNKYWNKNKDAVICATPRAKYCAPAGNDHFGFLEQLYYITFQRPVARKERSADFLKAAQLSLIGSGFLWIKVLDGEVLQHVLSHTESRQCFSALQHQSSRAYPLEEVCSCQPLCTYGAHCRFGIYLYTLPTSS